MYAFIVKLSSYRTVFIRQNRSVGSTAKRQGHRSGVRGTTCAGCGRYQENVDMIQVISDKLIAYAVYQMHKEIVPLACSICREPPIPVPKP